MLEIGGFVDVVFCETFLGHTKAKTNEVVQCLLIATNMEDGTSNETRH